MDSIEPLEKHAAALRDMAVQLEMLAMSEANGKAATALSITAENVRLSAKYLQVVIRLKRSQKLMQESYELRQKVRAASTS